MTRTAVTALLLAAMVHGCGSGGDEAGPLQPAIVGVQWHLNRADSDQLVYSASADPSFAYLYVTVRRSDGSSTTERAVGNCPTPHYCEFTPGDLLGIGPPIAYQVRLKGDVAAGHLSGNQLPTVPGAIPFALLLHVDHGNSPPFQPILEVTSPGAAPVVWVLSFVP